MQIALTKLVKVWA